jgi:hypothetical protein
VTAVAWVVAWKFSPKDKEIQRHVRVDRETGEVLSAENDFAAVAEELISATA